MSRSLMALRGLRNRSCALCDGLRAVAPHAPRGHGERPLGAPNALSALRRVPGPSFPGQAPSPHGTRSSARGGRAVRAVLLGRVSTDDKDQDPENQLRPLREAAARKGWTVVREISKHLSAWDNRAAEAVWRECLEPIRNGEADVLCVWSLDRLSRGGAEDVFAKIRVLEEHYGA